MSIVVSDLTPRATEPVETLYRRIRTPLPVPESLEELRRLRAVEPLSMAGMPPVLWHQAQGFLVRDPYGNQWIDLTSGIIDTVAGRLVFTFNTVTLALPYIRDGRLAAPFPGDANDVLYALEASHDYDPGPNLEKIRAPLLAINSADDLINPPELGILEREIKRVSHGRAVVIPLSDKTRGHGSHTIAALWKDQLLKLVKESQH